MSRMLIMNVLEQSEPLDQLCVKGWVRTKRENKQFSFVELNDGSCLANLQVIIDNTVEKYDELSRVATGAAIVINGKLVESLGKGQKWEVVAASFEILGLADETFPLQKKRHSLEYLRTIAHLRPRTNMFGAITRVRSKLAYAIHQFFQERNFVYIHTPIITASDCEGAGELFKVSTLDFSALPLEQGKVDFSQDFFGKPTYLTVSGQLEAEVIAQALSNVYTFGPTFRAENSNTARHASEFWMIEPEMAFYDLKDDMALAESFIKYLVNFALEKCRPDLELFAQFVDKSLFQRLEQVVNKPFKSVSYTDAIELLLKSPQTFEFPVKYGVDLQTEHEKYLTGHFNSPVTIYDYPKTIKPFYMRVNDDNKTVAAMDLLVPGIGEIVGGSQREERLSFLRENMERSNVAERDYEWYVDLRKYGSVPHSGFGLGFERLLMFVTGVANIRDVITFARTPKNADF